MVIQKTLVQLYFHSFPLAFLNPASENIITVRNLWNTYYSHRRGNLSVILITLNVLAGLIVQNLGFSLTKLCT